MRLIFTTILAVMFLASWAQSGDDNPWGHGRNKDSGTDQEMGRQAYNERWNLMNNGYYDQIMRSRPRVQLGGIIVEQGNSQSSGGGSRRGGSNSGTNGRSYGGKRGSKSTRIKDLQKANMAKAQGNWNAWVDFVQRKGEEHRAH